MPQSLEFDYKRKTDPSSKTHNHRAPHGICFRSDSNVSFSAPARALNLRYDV